MSSITKTSIEQLSINTIRTLAMDAIQKANSGHPGAPMALAPVSYALWRDFLKHNPKNPNWADRDRFVLSNGHASMLIYSMLHLTGYDLSLDDIRNFRQWGSKTAGHPEYRHTPGVETTTGPLGQGCMTAVGMAMAEAHLAARFNRDQFNIVDHFTYVICGDGDLMEGSSQEAISLAGHLGLGKLIFIYDDNHISIEGDTSISYSDNVRARFEACGWHVVETGDIASDPQPVSEAIAAARKETTRPSLVIARTHIAYGSPNKHDSAGAHGSPLGAEEISLTKAAYDWPDESFVVPGEVREHLGQAVDAGQRKESEWNELFASYGSAYPELASEFESAMKGELPDGWQDAVPTFDSSDSAMATRSASGKVINALADRLPSLVGGSADLAPSNKTFINSSGYFSEENRDQRNFGWGVREHLMCAASTGMIIHGGMRPFAGTFFIFSDYARPAIRLAALMGMPVIYVMTHDSIGVGEDGPTHQPIEHLASFRAMPNVCVIRPCDANETAVAWRVALEREDGPTMLVLSRQNLTILDRNKYAPADMTEKGGYVLSKEKGSEPDIVLLSTGSEIHLALAAQATLAQEDIDARVVSMPSWELFRSQSDSYRNEVIPVSVKARLAIEAGSSQGWHEWVGDKGGVIAIDSFGASAPAGILYEKFGLTEADIVARAKALTAK